MKKRSYKHSLWVSFVLNIFLIIVAVMAVASFGVFYVLRADPAGMRPVPHGPILVLILISLLIGTILAGIVGRRVLRPITDLSQATKRVAAGDFSVRLKPGSRVPEIAALYDDFDKMVRELSGIESLRYDFVDNVSHEFKTPLAAIEGYATLLMDERLADSERLEYARAITQSTRQLSAMASNILSISRLENQQIIAEISAFSVDEQVRRSLLALEPLWSAKRIELALDLGEATWSGSEDLMGQVWVNLISNAIKFSPEGGKVRVSVASTPASVSVSIGDEGIGMTEEEQRHIFERFYRASRSRSGDGNGLGLTLVKRILDLSGGTISVASAPGEGSTFTVELPRQEK